MGLLRVGYVVKRFPRASETFIAQEILELERQGVEVHVFSLWPNDLPARHAWLGTLAAGVTQCGGLPLSEVWKWLHARAAGRPDLAPGLEEALVLAFRHPSRRGRHRLAEAVGVARAAGERGLVHLHAHFANEPAFVALLAHHASGIPFSFTAHAKDIYAKAPARDELRRQVADAAFVVAVSESTRWHLARQVGGALASKVRRLYNGVDLEAIRPRPRGGEAPEILCVARLVEKKGIGILLRSLALLAARGAPYRCTVVGDGPLRPALERQRLALGLGPRVELAGDLCHEAVLERMGRADLFVLPSRVAADGDRDALPTVLLEAMASGLPCVSTQVGGIPEIVDDGTTGLLVPADAPGPLAGALGRLLRDRALGARMGAAGRRRAEALFDLRRNAATLRSWFGGGAGRRQAAGGGGR